jgi:hypothetical protein
MSRHPRDRFRIAMLLAGLAGCTTDATAVEHLEKEGFTDIVLTREDSTTFRFTATRGAQTCDGTLALRSAVIVSDHQISSSCRSGGEDVDAPVRAVEPIAALGRTVDYAKESRRQDVATVQSADDFASLAAKGLVQAMVAGDREWIAANSEAYLRPELARGKVASQILILRRLGPVGLGPPRYERRDEYRQSVIFDVQHSTDLGPLTVRVDFVDQRIVEFAFEGAGYGAAADAINEAAPVLTFVGAHLADDAGVQPWLDEDADEPVAVFVFHGLAQKRKRSKYRCKVELENLEDGTREPYGSLDGAEGMPTITIALDGLSRGDYRVILDFEDRHARRSLQVSHFVHVGTRES